MTEKINLPTLIERSELRFADVLPEGMDPKRVVRLAKFAVHRNPALLKCDPVSVIEAIVTACQLGLEINSPIGGAHLVPYKTRCQMIPDYRGLVKLALQNDDCLKLVAREVYDGDLFHIIQGTTESIEHVPMLGNEARMDDDITGFYAVATLKAPSGVVTVHEYASKGDVDKIRARSRAGNSGPWQTDYAAMGKKTMVKRVLKWLDLSPQLALAIEMDNRGDMGFSGSTTDQDSEADLSKDMAEKARHDQEEMSRNLADSRRTEIIGEEVE
jgi:recombination protein RecT